MRKRRQRDDSGETEKSAIKLSYKRAARWMFLSLRTFPVVIMLFFVSAFTDFAHIDYSNDFSRSLRHLCAIPDWLETLTFTSKTMIIKQLVNTNPTDQIVHVECAMAVPHTSRGCASERSLWQSCHESPHQKIDQSISIVLPDILVQVQWIAGCVIASWLSFWSMMLKCNRKTWWWWEFRSNWVLFNS